MKPLLAAAAIAAILAATVITACQPSRSPHAGADNKCPVGCVQTSDQSTIILPDIIGIPTRGPWIVGQPPGSGVQQTPSTYSTAANRPAPGRKP